MSENQRPNALVGASASCTNSWQVSNYDLPVEDSSKGGGNESSVGVTLGGQGRGVLKFAVVILVSFHGGPLGFCWWGSFEGGAESSVGHLLVVASKQVHLLL